MTRLLRITASLLALLMIACMLTSCDWIDRIKLHLVSSSTEPPRGIPEDNDRDYISTTTDDFMYSPYYRAIRPRHSYQLLTPGQQALYDALYGNVREIYPDNDADEPLYKTKQAIIEDHLLTTADIRVAAKALYDDNPELFWLSSTIYQLTDSRGGYTAVQMRSIYPPETIQSMQKEINTVVNAFFAEVPANLTPYEREKYVHDYIAAICEYDKEAAAITDPNARVREANQIYGTLVKHKAVCEGYARTMELLLNGLGVDCVSVTGIGYGSDGEEELHMWNAVDVENNWYFVDPTWDDQLYDSRRYQFFNLNEQMLNQDHSCSPALSDLSEEEINGDETFSSVAMNIFLPECTALDYEYYIYECPHLKNYDGEDVKDAVYRAALNREEFISVYIDPEHLDYDEAVDALFCDAPQYFFRYIEEINGWLSSYEIDNSNLSYYTNAERSAVTVMLNYY